MESILSFHPVYGQPYTTFNFGPENTWNRLPKKTNVLWVV